MLALVINVDCCGHIISIFFKQKFNTHYTVCVLSKTGHLLRCLEYNTKYPRITILKCSLFVILVGKTGTKRQLLLAFT